MNFQSKICRLIERYGNSPKQFAACVGCSRESVRLWAKGKPASDGIKRKIAVQLGVDAKWMLDDQLSLPPELESIDALTKLGQEIAASVAASMPVPDGKGVVRAFPLLASAMTPNQWDLEYARLGKGASILAKSIQRRPMRVKFLADLAAEAQEKLIVQQSKESCTMILDTLLELLSRQGSSPEEIFGDLVRANSQIMWNHLALDEITARLKALDEKRKSRP